MISSICVASSKYRILKFSFWVWIMFKVKHKYLAFLKKNYKIRIPNMNINNFSNHTLIALLRNSRAKWKKCLNVSRWGIGLSMESVWYLMLWKRLVIWIIVFQIRAINMQNFSFLFYWYTCLLVLFFRFQWIASGSDSSE